MCVEKIQYYIKVNLKFFLDVDLSFMCTVWHLTLFLKQLFAALLVFFYKKAIKSR